ncbi:MAG: hypothetical protein NZL96_03665 [Patescibacteria group bacterium]|nr:hypothetical protein [Patescibacteria group bacterium]
MVDSIPTETSEKIKKRVIKARVRQKLIFQGSKISSNGEMGTAEIKKFCHLEKEALDLLKEAIIRFSLSARGYFKIIKIAQTITDLNQKDIIEVEAVVEALQYRYFED